MRTNNHRDEPYEHNRVLTDRSEHWALCERLIDHAVARIIDLVELLVSASPIARTNHLISLKKDEICP